MFQSKKKSSILFLFCCFDIILNVTMSMSNNVPFKQGFQGFFSHKIHFSSVLNDSVFKSIDKSETKQNNDKRG